MHESQAVPNVLIKTLKGKTYTAQVKDLLITSGLSAKEIAEICGCSYQLVTFCRRQLNLPHVHQTTQQMLSTLEREVKQLRREIMRLDNLIEDFEDNKDVIGVASSGRTSHSSAAVCITAGKRLGQKH